MAQRVLRTLPCLVWRQTSLSHLRRGSIRFLHIDGNRFHALSQAWRSLRGPCSDARKVALVDCIRSAKLLLLRIATAAVLLILFVELYRLTAGYEALGIYQSITHTTSTTRLNTSIDRLPYR